MTKYVKPKKPKIKIRPTALLETGTRGILLEAPGGKVIRTFDNMQELRKWLSEHPEVVEQYGELYAMKIEKCYEITISRR